MSISFTSKKVPLSDRFRTYATEKSEKIFHLAQRAQSLEVKVTQENPNRGDGSDDRVELTLIGPGPVVRAESVGGDKFAAFDLAYGKLLERIRRAKDRRKVRRGRKTPPSMHDVSASGFEAVDVTPVDADSVFTGPIEIPVTEPEATEGEEYSPVVIRRKEFAAAPMTLDDALYEMELVGHDFFLFLDVETSQPSVVYKRKGWAYGVITLNPGEVSERAS